MRKTADVVIIGAGIIGASVAAHLVRRAPLRVALLEKEALVGTGATSKATGGIRFQFASEVDIRLTQLSLPEYLALAEETGVEFDFVSHGYLFVTAEPARFAQMRKNVALQNRLGVPSRLLTPAEVGRLFPQVRTEDLVGGTFCPEDGSANPSAGLEGFLLQARAGGCQPLTESPVVEIIADGGRVRGVRTPSDTYYAPVVVNAAGPHGDEVARLAAVDLPVRPYRRQVFVAEPIPDVPERPPMTIDIDTGWYVHKERRGMLLLGGTDKDTHPGHDTTVNWDDLERIVTAATRRAPAFAEAKVIRAYAGVRDLSPDFHVVLGPVPELEGFLCANGTSGHGFMHAPAIGRLIAEIILDGRATSLDIAPLSITRFREGQVHENTFTF
jgi:sarcosine oxidase subunit beta